MMSTSALKSVPFDSKDYWEERFSREGSFEWLLPYNSLRPILLPYLSKCSTILQLGCGNSSLAFDLYDDGYTNITNIDYAATVIKKMQEKSFERYGKEDVCALKWITADCLDLSSSPLVATTFDIILDKSVTDAIACGDDSHSDSKIQKLCSQVGHVARPGALWISISYAINRGFDVWTWKDDQGISWRWVTEELKQIEACQTGEKKPDVHMPQIFNYVYINRKTMVMTFDYTKVN